jgi:3-hydroxybutyryl-CoA dehydrogenase
MHVAIVGAGTMGTRVALRSAAYDCTVTLIGRDGERTRAALQRAADEEALQDVATRIAIATDLAAVGTAELVYEVVPENLATKRTLYAQLAALVPPETPLVSGTSSFVPEVLARPDERAVIVAHFLHPVTLVSLAELIAPAHAAPAALARVEAWLARTAMRPVRLARGIPGFLVNRLQFALLREALNLLDLGIASPAEIDLVIEAGLGPRWSATGPIASAQLGGWSTFGTIAQALVPELDARPEISRFAGKPPRDLDPEALARARQLRRDVVAAISAVRADHPPER